MIVRRVRLVGLVVMMLLQVIVRLVAVPNLPDQTVIGISTRRDPGDRRCLILLSLGGLYRAGVITGAVEGGFTSVRSNAIKPRRRPLQQKGKNRSEAEGAEGEWGNILSTRDA